MSHAINLERFLQFSLRASEYAAHFHARFWPILASKTKNIVYKNN